MKMAKGKPFNIKIIWALILVIIITIGFVYKISLMDFENGRNMNGDVDDKIYLYRPEQVHLSYGESASDIVVTWSTLYEVTNAFVLFGYANLTFIEKSNTKSYKFVDRGPARSTQFIYRITLTNLRPNTTYIYRCGSHKALSRRFWFHTPPNENENWIPSLAIFGDLGLKNGVILRQLRKDTQDRMYDAIIHNGDFAYDMASRDGLVGDAFMKRIEHVAAYVPYMTSVGNHELAYNFSHYRARFSMPGGTENLFYSFNLGPVHFIGFNTEVYFFFKHYGLKNVEYQYKWLERDLEEANESVNRAKRPWIVTFGHRPMYCSILNDYDCLNHDNSVRTGRTGRTAQGIYGLENLFYRYGVDVEFWAHEHCYERLWPIYNYTVYNGSLEEPYRNPRAPVHIVSGAAGNEQGNEYFTRKLPAWSAFRSKDFSFTRMKAYNATHLYFEQISGRTGVKVIDMFWLIKDKHGAYD